MAIPCSRPLSLFGGTVFEMPFQQKALMDFIKATIGRQVILPTVGQAEAALPGFRSIRITFSRQNPSRVMLLR